MCRETLVSRLPGPWVKIYSATTPLKWLCKYHVVLWCKVSVNLLLFWESFIWIFLWSWLPELSLPGIDKKHWYLLNTSLDTKVFLMCSKAFVNCFSFSFWQLTSWSAKVFMCFNVFYSSTKTQLKFHLKPIESTLHQGCLLSLISSYKLADFVRNISFS